MDYRGSMVAHVALPAAWGLNTTRRYPIGMVSVNHFPSESRPDKRQNISALLNVQPARVAVIAGARTPAAARPPTSEERHSRRRPEKGGVR